MTSLPALPLEEWEDTKDTLHLFTQIVGKVRLGLFPKTNHWWHVTLYLSSRGLTTRPIPFGDRLFEIGLDLIDHRLVISSSDGGGEAFDLPGLSVANFHAQLMQALARLDIEAEIIATPYDVPFSTTPFAEDTVHARYDREAISRFWRILVFVGSAFETFRARFIGKSTPVHLFWHHFDLALTRFSGEPAPPLSGGTQADREAYSHAVISFGFWPGDAQVREPAFYAYAYPEPPNMTEVSLHPAQALWNTDSGYAQAFIPYEAVREAADPTATLLEFLETTYRGFAERAGWDMDALALNVS